MVIEEKEMKPSYLHSIDHLRPLPKLTKATYRIQTHGQQRRICTLPAFVFRNVKAGVGMEAVGSEPGPRR